MGNLAPGGQDTPAGLSWPPGAKMPRVGAKIPREILAHGGQAAHGYLSPRGPSCPGAKINWDTGTSIGLKVFRSEDKNPEFVDSCDFIGDLSVHLNDPKIKSVQDKNVLVKMIHGKTGVVISETLSQTSLCINSMVYGYP